LRPAGGRPCRVGRRRVIAARGEKRKRQPKRECRTMVRWGHVEASTKLELSLSLGRRSKAAADRIVTRARRTPHAGGFRPEAGLVLRSGRSGSPNVPGIVQSRARQAGTAVKPAGLRTRAPTEKRKKANT